MTRPAPTDAMRFSLRTLLLLMFVAPLLLFGGWLIVRAYIVSVFNALAM